MSWHHVKHDQNETLQIAINNGCDGGDGDRCIVKSSEGRYYATITMPNEAHNGRGSNGRLELIVHYDERHQSLTFELYGYYDNQEGDLTDEQIELDLNYGVICSGRVGDGFLSVPKDMAIDERDYNQPLPCPSCGATDTR